MRTRDVQSLLLLSAVACGCATMSPGANTISVQRPCRAPFRISTSVDGRSAGDGHAFDDILETSVVFSADGKHVAYVARSGESMFVVHDGRRSAPWDGIGFLRYGEAGPVFAGQRKGQWCVARGNRQDSCFPILYEDSVTLAGKTVAYVGASPGGPSSLVVDGAVVAQGATLALVRASEDGAHVGCVVRADEAGGDDNLVLDGVSIAKAPRVFDWSPGGDVTWVTKRGGEYVVESRGRPALGPYRMVSPLITAGSHVAFVATTDAGQFLVLDGVSAGPFVKVLPRSVVLSPQGNELAAAVVLEPAAREVAYEVATIKRVFHPSRWPGPAKEVPQLVFSADGRTLGITSVTEETGHGLNLVSVESGTPVWSMVRFDDVSDLALSADGTRVVALTRNALTFRVLSHCPSCGGRPEFTALNWAMPGTLVADEAASRWAVLSARRVKSGEPQQELFVASSMFDWEQAYDASSFAVDVQRLDAAGAEDPVISAWRRQIRGLLDRQSTCLAP